MRKEWVLLKSFCGVFLQFLQLPTRAGGAHPSPGSGCSTPGLLWGQIQQIQGREEGKDLQEGQE